MADGKVTVIARIKAKPGLEETVKKEVMNLVSPTRSEAGCRWSRITRNGTWAERMSAPSAPADHGRNSGTPCRGPWPAAGAKT